MNAEISEAIKARNLGLGMHILELLAQNSFVYLVFLSSQVTSSLKKQRKAINVQLLGHSIFEDKAYKTEHIET